MSCSTFNLDDIVAWIRKFMYTKYLDTPLRALDLLRFAAEGVDPFEFLNGTSAPNEHQIFVRTIMNVTTAEGPPVDMAACPGPEPFVQNTNSNIAFLMSGTFNGTQPEHDNNYTCYVNGVPRATVEIIVLGE